MVRFIKRYWDIFGGLMTSAVISAVAQFELERIQLCYSEIILMIVCIGVFRIVKENVDKCRHNERKHSIIDMVVDGQKPIKAYNIAQEPTKQGEILGKKIIQLWGEVKPAMEKIKTFFMKFKGYLLTGALAILTIVEMCGGFINASFGGVLTINGVDVLPLVTLACTVVVGLISNGYTPEQREKIKALFSKSNTNELVMNEIKKAIKEKSAELSTATKALATQEHELDNLNSELERLKNVVQAKREMMAMVPQLATEADVKTASEAVTACEKQITEKKSEIAKTATTVDELTRTLNSLRSQV